jgi:hypothetical protein
MTWVGEPSTPNRVGARLAALYWSISFPAYDDFKTLRDVSEAKGVPYRTLQDLVAELDACFKLSRSPALIPAPAVEPEAPDDEFQIHDEREQTRFRSLQEQDEVFRVRSNSTSVD